MPIYPFKVLIRSEVGYRAFGHSGIRGGTRHVYHFPFILRPWPELLQRYPTRLLGERVADIIMHHLPVSRRRPPILTDIPRSVEEQHGLRSRGPERRPWIRKKANK
jgi:hypothetical protein